MVNQADQTITFGPLGGKTFGDPDFAVSATASSGLAVSFSIASGPASVAGNIVHITGAGTVTVRASQPGDTNYNAAANVDQSFVVAKANQTITFAAVAGQDLRRCSVHGQRHWRRIDADGSVQRVGRVLGFGQHRHDQ